jgi:hypothetical protein
MSGGPHVALVGDSIFDNGAYTEGEPDVAAHLRAVLPAAWTVTLCAVDGATLSSVGPQLRRVPADASHIVVALGGNDALRSVDLLDRPVRSTAEALALFDQRVAAFRGEYERAVDAVLHLNRITAVCTIYNGQLERHVANVARLALAMFNDAIIAAALERRLDIVELRAVCTDPADYANPIEPSGRGGRKIAQAVARCIGALDPERRPTQIVV